MGATQSVTENSIHEFTVKMTELYNKYRDRGISFCCLKLNSLEVAWYSHILGRNSFGRNIVIKLADYGPVPISKVPDSGFEILAFPCNQFLKQEPGTSEEAKEFACTRYKAQYPIFQKIRVNGPDAEPVYKFLKKSKSGCLGSRIKWNFTKFLIDKEGKVISRYSLTTAPLSLEGDIKKALGVA